MSFPILLNINNTTTQMARLECQYYYKPTINIMSAISRKCGSSVHILLGGPDVIYELFY